VDNPHRIQLMGRVLPTWVIGLFLVALGMVAYAPYFSMGFSGDDFMFISMLEGALPYNPWLGFWYGDMVDFPGFTQLWWFQEGISGAFLRPLPAWVISFLYFLFQRNAFPYHALSAFVHGLSAFIGFLLLRKLTGHDKPSLLAAFLFLICEDHAMTVAWITTLTDLLCAFFLYLALLCHISARESWRLWLFVASILLALLGMLCKETAAIYPVIIMAYEFIFAGRLKVSGSEMSFKQRIRLFAHNWWAWVTLLALFSVYLILYQAIVPPMRTLLYQDPFSQPLRYLGMMLVNLPVMYLSLISPFFPSLAAFIPGILGPLAAAGGILLVLLFVTLLPYKEQRSLWFVFLLFFLGLLPGLAADPGERLLYYPSLFGFYVVAWLIIQIPSLIRQAKIKLGSRERYLGLAWGGYLLFATLILPLILLFAAPGMWISGMLLPENSVLESLPFIDDELHEHVIFLNTNSSYNTFYLPDIYRYHRGEFIDLRQLSSFKGYVWARQDSAETLTLKTDGHGWLDNLFARAVRLRSGFHAGDNYDTPLFRATILEVTTDGEDVLQVRFEFNLPLNDPSLVIFYFDGDTYRRWQPSEEWQRLNMRLDPEGF